MRYFKAICNICGATVNIDVAEFPGEEAIESFLKVNPPCPGNHINVENHGDWLIEDRTIYEGETQTEAEWVANLKKDHQHVVSNDDLSSYLAERCIAIESFAFGACVLSNGKVADFARSPEGKRYYFWND